MKVAVISTMSAMYSFELVEEFEKYGEVLFVVDAKRLASEVDADRLAAFEARGRLVRFSQDRIVKYTNLFKILGAIVAFRPDVVVAHEHFHPHIALMYQLIARLSGARLMLIVHDPKPHTGRDGDAAAARARWVRLERAAAQGYLTHGRFCANQLKSVYEVGAKPVLAVPHGPQMRPKAPRPPAHPRQVLMFGRMEAYKGLDVLLAAVRVLADRDFPIDVRVVGGGPELDRLEPAFEALGCQVVNRYIPQDDAIQAFQDAGICVAPYTEATQSGVVAAAFGNARPVIASDVGGLPDMVRDGHNGLLVPPNDPEALADAIIRLSQDAALREALGRNALASAEGELSWAQFARLVVEDARAAKIAA